MKLRPFFLVYLVLMLTGQTSLLAQLSDIGGIVSVGVTKNIGRNWDSKLEQELRFNQSLGYDRALTALQLDYKVIPQYFKVGMEYDFMNPNIKSEYYEFRHRAAFQLSGQTKWNRFELQLRTRMQSTWRDETKNDYKFNPKVVWRNKFECAYDIFGSPIKPSMSAELFFPVNSSHGFYLNSYRLRTAVSYKYSRSQSIEMFLRFDKEVQTNNPESVLYLGVAWLLRL